MSTPLASSEPLGAVGFQPPMVYVSEDPAWEYKHLVRDLAVENALGEDELNALGADGWEFVCAFACVASVHFYLKRLAR